jgi:3-oxoacyl-[acyl-carrier protein] reductase
MLEDGFRDAVVVVVGGRGGIGSEVVRLAAELGAKVAIASRSGADTADLPVDAGFTLDVTDNDSIRAFCRAIEARYGRVDVFVNTAGSSHQVPAERIDLLDDALIEQVLAENARAPLLLMREMAPLLRKGRDPVIVNLSSIAAQTGGGSNMAYAAAKAALETASRAMARALAPAVRVVTVAPSALETGFVRGRGADYLHKTAGASALKRLASLREVAVAVLCAARLLTATTGSCIEVDAGRHL